MKKIILVIVLSLLFVGCNEENIKKENVEMLIGVHQNHNVHIGGKRVGALKYKDDLYVDINELEAFDFFIDENTGKVYLSEYDFPRNISNERSYNWYLDQGGTGTHSEDNCGPSSSVMAAKWQNKDFKFTTEEARGEFRSSGGAWYTDDVKDFFEDRKIHYEVDDFDGPDEIQLALSRGNIVLLCIDTSYLTYRDEKDDYIGRFYSYSGGHFIIAKGYTYINRELYFEVYDSNCWDEKYSDGSPKGKDRLYSSTELEEAIENWWDYYIIIEDE